MLSSVSFSKYRLILFVPSFFLKAPEILEDAYQIVS